MASKNQKLMTPLDYVSFLSGGGPVPEEPEPLYYPVPVPSYQQPPMPGAGSYQQYNTPFTGADMDFGFEDANPFIASDAAPMLPPPIAPPPPPEGWGWGDW